jgi:hypothetical protein
MAPPSENYTATRHARTAVPLQQIAALQIATALPQNAPPQIATAMLSHGVVESSLRQGDLVVL